MLFAQKIKAARVRSGLLQKQLASALNIDVPMYSRIERGDRQAKKEQVVLLSDIRTAPIRPITPSAPARAAT